MGETNQSSQGQKQIRDGVKQWLTYMQKSKQPLQIWGDAKILDNYFQKADNPKLNNKNAQLLELIRSGKKAHRNGVCP